MFARQRSPPSEKGTSPSLQCGGSTGFGHWEGAHRTETLISHTAGSSLAGWGGSSSPGRAFG
eukprot:1988634-Rhodomonas_salina.1